MNSLKKNQTWVLAGKPKRQKLVGCKWIYKRKAGILVVEMARYKARLVAKGLIRGKALISMRYFL